MTTKDLAALETDARRAEEKAQALHEAHLREAERLRNEREAREVEYAQKILDAFDQNTVANEAQAEATKCMAAFKDALMKTPWAQAFVAATAARLRAYFTQTEAQNAAGRLAQHGMITNKRISQLDPLRQPEFVTEIVRVLSAEATALVQAELDAREQARQEYVDGAA